jgi:hypothetical protein
MIPKLSFTKMQEIIEPAMGRNTDMGGYITNTELQGIISALRDLIPALRENTTTTVEVR